MTDLGVRISPGKKTTFDVDDKSPALLEVDRKVFHWLRLGSCFWLKWRDRTY
jgi:hypothetical protein